MNEQKYEGLINKLVSNARAIITEEIGLSIGCSKMNTILSWLKPYESVDTKQIRVFSDYDEAINPIPYGSARLYCSKEAFEKYDGDLYAINQKFRKRILEACFAIIDKYGDKDNKLNL